ncbi:transporter smf2 [Microdochium trichocladiopsis]|uniref:Transporter smf2 n=1 Tax=Microdochium trichocladiopsis TaxID=1682393 RepID=A0A9P8XXI9_9PEZI|nr:transporter smf2 [Microdochium trichocladiopsis]KAH7024661.1 transporter smf2 [Microdochium trichocladiopsis]
MNKTSRTDEPYEGDGLNQSPNELSNDLVTNQDLNGIANERNRRGRDRVLDDSGQAVAQDSGSVPDSVPAQPYRGVQNLATLLHAATGQSPGKRTLTAQVLDDRPPADTTGGVGGSLLHRARHGFLDFAKFIGPGFLVAVAYIDPGNYATDIAAGASYRFRLLFIILMSNLFAILLQSLAIKLGSVTGLNLAEACRAFLPRWLNYFLYFMAEAAIIATDIAEVIGTAIALNLLCPQIPLVAGCAISIIDVLFILVFYRPGGSLRGLRGFEFFIVLLVLGVVICFCIQLSFVQGTTPGEVFKGYLPNNAVTESQGLYQACGILGATVMPHSLYLGSGIVQSRLRDYDTKHGLLPAVPSSAASSINDDKAAEKTFYIPSLRAIKHSLKYSYVELALCLFTFALFVNSAILIVAGASLYQNSDALDADIFGIHALLTSSLSPAAGTIFALALLFSGVSAGIVATISGQMVCEGALRWHMRPWMRRLITRSISITPSIIIAGAAGREKLNDALEGSQVALSIVLPFVSAPLIWFTCFNKYMTVQPGMARYRVEDTDNQQQQQDGADMFETPARPMDEERNPVTSSDTGVDGSGLVKMANPLWLSLLAGIVWLIIVVMNVANLVLIWLGE